MICHKTKSIFIHIPKTAGTSVEIMFGAVEHDKNYNAFKETCQGKHMMLRNYYDSYPKESNDYYKWTIIRNSWEKDYSFYCMHKTLFEWHNKKPAKSFKDFLRKNVMPNWENSQKYKLKKKLNLTRMQWHSAIVHANQLDYIILDGKIYVDEIINYDKLNVGWKKVCKKIKKPYEKLIVTRNVPKEPMESVYDQETIDLVAKMRKEDIEYFKFDIPFKSN
jgi:hypothetical protein